jgi:hypothetical protein
MEGATSLLAREGGHDSDGSAALNVGAGIVQETVGECGILAGTGVAGDNSILPKKNGVGDGALNTDGDSGTAGDDVLVMSDVVVVLCANSDIGGLNIDGDDRRVLRAIGSVGDVLGGVITVMSRESVLASCGGVRVLGGDGVLGKESDAKGGSALANDISV